MIESHGEIIALRPGWVNYPGDVPFHFAAPPHRGRDAVARWSTRSCLCWLSVQTAF